METIAVANQKGGCGKTTTAINLAACLGNRGKRVLLIDMDPQGHASLGLGQACEEREGLYEVFLREATLDDVIVSGVAKGVDLVPGTISLAAVEHLLADTPEREWRLASHLASVSDRYDFSVIDCPPSLGLLAFNALRAANRVLVPVDLSIFSLDGVERLNETIDLLSEKYNAQMSVTIVPTMVDYRPRFSRDILRELRGMFPEQMSQAMIHTTVRLKEAAYRGMPVIQHDPDCVGALDYDRLAREVMGEQVGRVTVTAFRNAAPAGGGKRPIPASGRAADGAADNASKKPQANGFPLAAAGAEGETGPLSRAVSLAAGAAGVIRYEVVNLGGAAQPVAARAEVERAPRTTKISRFVSDALEREVSDAASDATSNAASDAESADQTISTRPGQTPELAEPPVFALLNDTDRAELLSALAQEGQAESTQSATARSSAAGLSGQAADAASDDEDAAEEMAEEMADFDADPILSALLAESMNGIATPSQPNSWSADGAEDFEVLESVDRQITIPSGEESGEVLAAAAPESLEATPADAGDVAEDVQDLLLAPTGEPAKPASIEVASDADFNAAVRRAGGAPPSFLAHRSQASAAPREITLLFKGMGAKRVQLAGDFNGWIPDRGVNTQVRDGHLVKVMKLEPGEYQYRVVVDGIWQEDPGNPVRVANIYGGSNSLLRVDESGEAAAL